MSKNRDKEYDKEVENLKRTQIAWVKEYAPDALTPEEIIEKIVEREVEVEVIKIEKEIVEKIVDNPENLKKIEELELDVQGLNDIISDRNIYINDLNVNNAAAAVSISEYKETKKDSEAIIKKLEEKNLKLKKAVEQLSTE